MPEAVPEGPTQLEREFFETVRYFDLFDQPLTATQLWRMRIVLARATEKDPAVPLGRVQERLRQSGWLGARLGCQWGYYTLVGREGIVPVHLARYATAQMKWKLTQRVGRWLTRLPLVEMVAMSGSLAAANTRRESDLDLFVVTHSRRIWTTRLLLVLATQLTGRRRRYWDQEAPDRVCLNHYVTEDSLTLPGDVQHIYMAMLCRLFVPLTGEEVYRRLLAANEPWVGGYFTGQPLPLGPLQQQRQQRRLSAWWQRFSTALLAEPAWDWLERLAERGQRALIERHRTGVLTGRVALSDGELAFHPGTRVPILLRQFGAPGSGNTT